MNEAATLATYYSKRLKLITTLLLRPAGNVSDEDIHKLRVQLKKLKAFTQLVQYCKISFRRKKFLKPYNKLFKEAGKVRELQIELSMLKKWNVLYVLNRYAAHLRKRLKKAKHHLLSNVDVRLVQKFEARSTLIVPCFKVVQENKVRQFLETKSRAMDELVSATDLKEEQIHELRKILKTFYYTLLIFYVKDETFKNMDAFQELLGQWHDAVVTKVYLQKAIEAGDISHAESKHIADVMHTVSTESALLLQKVKLQLPDFICAKQQSLSALFSKGAVSH